MRAGTSSATATQATPAAAPPGARQVRKWHGQWGLTVAAWAATRLTKTLWPARPSRTSVLKPTEMGAGCTMHPPQLVQLTSAEPSLHTCIARELHYPPTKHTRPTVTTLARKAGAQSASAAMSACTATGACASESMAKNMQVILEEHQAAIPPGRWPGKWGLSCGRNSTHLRSSTGCPPASTEGTHAGHRGLCERHLC